MLDLLNISKTYGRKKVLNNISFSIGPGTLNGITGENGAGKSTLLKIIIGELSADTGTVHVKGKIGYCPQEPLVFSRLTVEENFRYFAAAYGMMDKNNPEKWIERRGELIDLFGFTDYLHHRVDQLSGGTRQKLNLSISLLHNPDILILDEPYGGFDWDSYQHFWELTLQLKDQGRSILMVTHFLTDAPYFDQIFRFQEGRLQ